MIEPAEKNYVEGLLERFRKPLRRFFAKRLGHRHDEIEDLVQEVFTRIAAGARPDSSVAVESYLFQTATNLLRDRWRRMKAREAEMHEPYDEALHGNSAEYLSAERNVLGHEALERLIAALYGLPERTRSVWVLYHFEDMSHADIARHVGIAKSTVEKHMSRANAHLLDALERYR